MAERWLVFLLFLTACSGNLPKVVSENDIASVVEQPIPKDFDPSAFQQYKQRLDNGKTRTVLNGGAAGIINYLAQTQVQWLQEEEQGLQEKSLVVVLNPGIAATDPRLLDTVLEGLGFQLVATGDTNHLVYLRSDQIREDIILATSQYPGDLTEAAGILQFDTAGVSFQNTTGIPLQMDQETIDFYLPSMLEFFGDSIREVDFWLEVEALPGVKMVAR